MIVCDTGPLVAAALSNDADHAACVRLLTDMHAAGRDLLVPATVTAEVGYLLAREAGARVESLFLRSLADGDFAPVDLTAADYARMAELVRHVWRSPPGYDRRLGDRGCGAAQADGRGHPGPAALHRCPAQPRELTDTAAITAATQGPAPRLTSASAHTTLPVAPSGTY